MDILSDVFRSAGLKRKILHQRSLQAGETFRFPCAKSIGFHVLTQGEAFIQIEGHPEPVALKRGDVAFMARGHDHTVRASETTGTLVSGAYQLWNDPIHPFFSDLPEWYLLRADEIGGFDRLSTIVSILAEEVMRPAAGSESIVGGLLDVLFGMITRRIVEERGARAEGWARASAEPQVRKALELMHADCARAWTLEDLAREAGLSRAGLADKFKRSLGDTPLRYLTSLRIQRAIELLSGSDETVESIAEAVGYGDPFSFSKAFKKTTGVPPRDFRTRDRSERDVRNRF